MAGGLISRFLVIAIIVGVVIFVAIWASGAFFRDSVFPWIENIGFTSDNASVEWLGDINLTYPSEIIYYIDGRDAKLYLWYDDELTSSGSEDDGPPIGWSWSSDKDDWFRVGNEYLAKFNDLSNKNKGFLRGLKDMSPEEGLEIIINRSLGNEEGNRRFLWVNAWKHDVRLRVKIGGWNEEYKASDKRLRNIEDLIDKFNQISRGVVKARGDMDRDEAEKQRKQREKEEFDDALERVKF